MESGVGWPFAELASLPFPISDLGELDEVQRRLDLLEAKPYRRKEVRQ